MNRKIVLFVIGRILLLEAGLMLLPLIVSFIYGEDLIYKFSYLISIILLLISGIPMCIKKPTHHEMRGRDGFVIVSFSWILLALFGALPLYISGDIPSFIDAYFEAVSGFTTTGSSIITDLTIISNSNLFWRSFTHFVGGMGVLVLALAVFPKMSGASAHIMKAEVPGPTFGKLVSKLSSTARVLYKIYIFLTFVVFVMLLFGKMSIFDALVHAFGAAGTGGFGIKNGSIAFYNSSYIDIVLGISMLVFGVNFNIYYLILIGKAKEAIKSEELKCYLGIVLVSMILIFFDISRTYDSILVAIRDVFFTVSSIITTTGYSTADFGTWPTFSKWILISLMFIGGSAGSTAGGLKVSRIAIALKSALYELKKMVSPNRVISMRYDHKHMEDTLKRSVSNYILLYGFIFFILVMIVSLTTDDFLTSFSAVAATFNNIGPGLGIVGPSSSYQPLSDLSKITLSFAMLAGRLEIFPMILLFAPSTWKHK